MGKHTDMLTAHDRCDSRGCGAQAYVRATFLTGSLLWCAHHAVEHKHAMMPTLQHWHDETARLAEKI